MLERIRAIDPQNPFYLFTTGAIAYTGGDLVESLRLVEQTVKIDIDDPEALSMIAMTYFDLGDVSAAKYWNDAASRLDPEAPLVRLVAMLLHLYNGEKGEAIAIARKLARPDSRNRYLSLEIALRMLAALDLAAGNYEDVINRYLIHYPDLADRRFPAERFLFADTDAQVAFMVTLDLASAYLRAGQTERAESLFSLAESELLHWPRRTMWGHDIADVELHALRGEKELALAALKARATAGMRYQWRSHLLYNPNLDSIRDTPEFAAIIAEIEADMAAQLARVREMERNGELEPIPETSARSQ
jgi:tetratricopeptide (TPR) repeat protein